MYALKMPLSAITGCQVPWGNNEFFDFSMLKKNGNSVFFKLLATLMVSLERDFLKFLFESTIRVNLISSVTYCTNHLNSFYFSTAFTMLEFEVKPASNHFKV